MLSTFLAVSSVKSESSENSGEFINAPVITSEVTQTFQSILNSYTDVNEMLTETAVSPKRPNNDFNNKSNTITVNTNNTSLLSCGNSDATSNNSSMNNSPSNMNHHTQQEQHSPNYYSVMRPLINPFARLPNDLLLQTSTTNTSFVNYNTLSTTNNNNNNTINLQFQMMPHLTNSFA